jgi:hypothetical protein
MKTFIKKSLAVMALAGMTAGLSISAVSAEETAKVTR